MLSSKLNAAILLIGKNTLNTDTKSVLSPPKNIYIIGGDNTVITFKNKNLEEAIRLTINKRLV
ncbi:cell wall-binding repeat-containing protein [Clostridium acetireducens]|uniref:cell wall-binding repeat-containing protein n=1 Tax=Clostridium acetireducens TaxID=76489 RepID=UPI00087236E2|nr:cell wall-binding repeat-containing protein [Clostridium acetireducens]